MDGVSDPSLHCPLQVADCPVIRELNRLQGEVRRLEARVDYDALTGYYNFGRLVKALGDEMERTRRTGLPTGLIMIGLDHFKRINDTLGHQTGNQVLKWVSGRIQGTIRRLDIAGRYGGEELTVLLPGTGMPQAVCTAERLRETIAAGIFPGAGGTLRITASFGVDTYHGRYRLTAAQFLERVDGFLLAAKRNGRNRICYDAQRLATEATEVSEQERSALFSRRP